MVNFWSQVIEILDRDDIVAVVSIIKADGSTPRDVGTRMAVTKEGSIIGTIGGGSLEFAVIKDAIGLISNRSHDAYQRDWPLGPEIGQCCGGRVRTLTEIFDKKDRTALVQRSGSEAISDRAKLVLFGAGHVGRALVLALASLPFDIRWVDTREDAFPSLIVQTARPIVSFNPVQEVVGAPEGALILIMTHSHAIDFEIVEAALKKPSLAYVGLIGSETKRTRFESRLRGLGVADHALARLHCPIGIPGISGKEPAIIAASVAADLLIRQEGLHKRSETASFQQEVAELLV